MADSGMEHIKIESAELSSGVWQIRIEGSLDWSNFAKVETAIEDIFKKNVYKVVVNLKGTKYISSAGFGCFISSLDTAMKNNGDLVFASTPPEIQDVFNILGLSKILRFAEDAPAALALFKK
ncbi:MAG TPA: STAS domain-containing protein [Planctomycetota bacterium]|nr:STAS domain-containing protein [Planctomycetota bacterium]